MDSTDAYSLAIRLAYRQYHRKAESRPRAVNYWRAVALTLKGLRREVAHG